MSRSYIIPEYGSLERRELGDRLFRRLETFDAQHARKTGYQIFDWRYRNRVRATQYVGVVQLPGLTIEILPKVDVNPTPREMEKAEISLARQNLLFMLSITKNIPIRERDLAAVQTEKMPLLEALIALFVTRLHNELRRGLDHAYVHHEQNQNYIRGKLLLSEHLRENRQHAERFFVGFDEFVADTWLNRILKATCRRLLAESRNIGVQQRLREGLLLFGDVGDCELRTYHFDRVTFNRNNERFRCLLDFCRFVHDRSSPSFQRGEIRCFSLFFPMDRLFEEFIAEYVKLHAVHLGLERSNVYIQARGAVRWLLKDAASGKPMFRLRPDVIIRDSAACTRLILDTKWKRLSWTIRGVGGAVDSADIYQLYSYAHRYDCGDNVLLFPSSVGTKRAVLHVERENHVAGEQPMVRIEFIEMNRNLRKDEASFRTDLSGILGYDSREIQDHVSRSCD
jgi:5-methylcytosine-specific restriction enzyme subunit McrC